MIADDFRPSYEAGNRIEPTEGPDVVFRCLPDDKSEGNVTFLTVAPWKEKSTAIWERAVKEAKRFVNTTMRGSQERHEFLHLSPCHGLTIP
jgi:hypothetical protein